MTQQPEDGVVRGRVRGLWLVWMAVGLALASAVLVANLLVVLPPLPGRAQADGFTGMVSVIGDLVARLAGLFTLGGLAAIVSFTSAGEDAALTDVQRRIAGWTGRAGQLWLVSALLMTVANPTFVAGAPLGTALRPDGWWLYLTSTPSALAWFVAALAALATTVVAYTGTRTASFAVCWIAGALATVFVAVTGNVSVGLDHDWATDAQGLAALAGVVLGSGAVAVVLAALAGSDAQAAAVRRYRRAMIPLVAVMAAGYTLVAWQQLAGQSPFAAPAGLPFLVGAGCLVALSASWGWRARRARRQAQEVGGASVAFDAAVVVLGVAAITAMTHIPPPRFEVPQTPQINYLGYEVNLPATIERLAGLGRPNLLWVALCLAAIGLYLWGVARVRRAGGHWPVSQLVPWLAGWGLTLYLAVSGLWMYSTAVFSWHMLVHMTVNMLVPLLVVLGAPFGLLAAATDLPPAEQSGPGVGAETPSSGRSVTRLPGVTELLDGLAAHRFVRFLLSPPVLWINYIGSLFVVYFTPLFPWMMRYHWAHQVMLLHFMLAGFLFFNLLVRPDRTAGRLPPIVRFAMLISVMPFHAIFAVGIMMARSVIGEQFYESIAVEWVGPLLADQDIAGQITWFTGEIPAFIAVAVLAFQWFRSDSREAAQVDREADEGVDEMAAYNELLAELAERDRREAGRGPR